MVGLLLAIGGLQLYGQQRNARERIKTETRFAEQTTRLTEQTSIIESGFAEQTTRLTEQAAIVESGFDDLNSRLLEILPIIVRITEEEKCKQGCGLTGLSACFDRDHQRVVQLAVLPRKLLVLLFQL